MSKQVINTGVILNDGSGDTLRVAGGKINNNFNDIYTKLGDGSEIQFVIDFETPPADGQVLQYDSTTGTFIPGEAGARGFTGATGPQGPTGPVGPTGPQGDGNITGPVTSTLNAIPRFGNTTGTILQNTQVTIGTGGVITGTKSNNVIPFYHVSQATFPNPSTYAGALAYSEADARLYFADNGNWNSLAKDSEVIKNILAGPGISVVVGSGNVTISNTGIGTGVDSSGFGGLYDVINLGLTIDDIAYPAIGRIEVTAADNSAYQMAPYSGNNPTIYAISGTTIAFKLTQGGTHPFLIQTTGGSNYDTGLVHVSTSGTKSTGASAQGKTTGTLYWRIPVGVSGTYHYQCQVHPGMVGNIVIKDITAI